MRRKKGAFLELEEAELSSGWKLEGEDPDRMEDWAEFGEERWLGLEELNEDWPRVGECWICGRETRPDWKWTRKWESWLEVASHQRGRAGSEKMVGAKEINGGRSWESKVEEARRVFWKEKKSVEEIVKNGKIVSSKDTCLEIKNLLMERSKYL